MRQVQPVRRLEVEEPLVEQVQPGRRPLVQPPPPQPALEAATPQVGSLAFYRWVQATQAPLPRSIFRERSHWHLMVALRALADAGHDFDIEGSCFDLESEKPKAPQCSRCLATFAMAKLHAVAKEAAPCVAVATRLSTPLVIPQRLRPQRDYRVCGYHAHASHQLGHFRGRVWCYACASTFAVTSSRLPKAIVDACNERNVEDTSRRNLAFLVAGGLPPAWRAGGWARGSDFGLVGFA